MVGVSATGVLVAIGVVAPLPSESEFFTLAGSIAAVVRVAATGVLTDVATVDSCSTSLMVWCSWFICCLIAANFTAFSMSVIDVKDPSSSSRRYPGFSKIALSGSISLSLIIN